MSLASIRTAFATSPEAQQYLSTQYAAIFGQHIGSATLTAAQGWLNAGESVQQIVAIWAAVAPQVLSAMSNIVGLATDTDALDATISQISVSSLPATVKAASLSTQAKTDISDLFVRILGYTPDSTGYAGNNDAGPYWVNQLLAGRTLSQIASLFAHSTEASSLITQAYQAVYNFSIGTASLQAAQAYLANGGSLAELKAFWSDFQPRVVQALLLARQSPSQANIDLAMAQATRQIASGSAAQIEFVVEQGDGSSLDQIFDLNAADSDPLVIRHWSGSGGTGSLERFPFILGHIRRI